jgi:DNA-binding transcriptional LysR family regulator
MPVKLNDLEMFVEIVDTGSISRAAHNLDVPKSRVSRHLRELEDTLDVRLLDRTTRKIGLTEAGEQVYADAQQILGNVEALQANIVQNPTNLSGRLSVFAPGEFTFDVLNPYLGEFARQYPSLELEFLSGAARPDLLHDRLDLIIHPHAPDDSSFVAVRLCRGRTDFYAAPAYLEENGSPQHPSEFYHHNCIAELDQKREPRAWLYGHGPNLNEARIQPRYRSDSMTGTRALAQQGLGIAMLPVFVAERAVEESSLVGLFDGKYQTAQDVYGIYSSRRMKPRKLEAFLQFLSERLPELI